MKKQDSEQRALEYCFHWHLQKYTEHVPINVLHQSEKNMIMFFSHAPPGNEAQQTNTFKNSTLNESWGM